MWGAEGRGRGEVGAARKGAGGAVRGGSGVGGLGGEESWQAQVRGMVGVRAQRAGGRSAPEECPRVGFLGGDAVADEFGSPCCEGNGDAPEGVRDGACAIDAEGGR